MSSHFTEKEAYFLQHRWAAHALRGKPDFAIEDIMHGLKREWDNNEPLGLGERLALAAVEIHTTIPNFGSLNAAGQYFNGPSGIMDNIDASYGVTAGNVVGGAVNKSEIEAARGPKADVIPLVKRTLP